MHKIKFLLPMLVPTAEDMIMLGLCIALVGLMYLSIQLIGSGVQAGFMGNQAANTHVVQQLLK